MNNFTVLIGLRLLWMVREVEREFVRHIHGGMSIFVLNRLKELLMCFLDGFFGVGRLLVLFNTLMKAPDLLFSLDDILTHTFYLYNLSSYFSNYLPSLLEKLSKAKLSIQIFLRIWRKSRSKSFSSDPSCQDDVGVHHSHSFSVGAAQVGIFE